jgi:hypothetical protein
MPVPQLAELLGAEIFLAGARDRGAKCPGAVAKRRIVNRGQYYQDARASAQDRLRGCNSADTRHDDIHEYKVRKDSFDCIDCFFARASLAYEHEPRGCRDEIP